MVLEYHPVQRQFAPERESKEAEMDRIIELAEERAKIAEELGVSVAGLLADVHCYVNQGDDGDAIEAIKSIDAMINEARKNSKNHMPVPVAEVRELLTLIIQRLAAIERTLSKT